MAKHWKLGKYQLQVKKDGGWDWKPIAGSCCAAVAQPGARYALDAMCYFLKAGPLLFTFWVLTGNALTLDAPVG